MGWKERMVRQITGPIYEIKGRIYTRLYETRIKIQNNITDNVEDLIKPLQEAIDVQDKVIKQMERNINRTTQNAMRPVIRQFDVIQDNINENMKVLIEPVIDQVGGVTKIIDNLRDMIIGFGENINKLFNEILDAIMELNPMEFVNEAKNSLKIIIPVILLIYVLLQFAPVFFAQIIF